MKKKIISFFTEGQARTVKARKNIAGMLFLKGLSILLSFIIVPMTINYVSSYQYGIWLTISSLVAWLSFFDIGLGNGMKNKFIEAVSVGKIKLAKIYVSTTYTILILIVLIIWITISILNLYIDWSSILKVPAEMKIELRYVVFIVLTNFALQFVLKLIATLLNALQKPAFSSLFDTLSQIILAVIILLLTYYTEGSLIYLALALLSSQVLVIGLGTLWVYTHELKRFRPSYKFVRFGMAKGLMSLGVKFFFLQIIAIIIYQTNNIIISRNLGPGEVSVYNIAFKYMSIINMLYIIILTPFWSAFTESKTVGDYEWMKKSTKRLRKVFFMFCLVGMILVCISPLVYKIWLGDKLFIPFIVTFLMLFYQIANTWGALHTQLLAGLGKIKLQLIFSSICGMINIPISVFFCKLWGLPGLVLGNTIVLSIFGSWFGYIQVNKILNKNATGIWNK